MQVTSAQKAFVNKKLSWKRSRKRPDLNDFFQRNCEQILTQSKIKKDYLYDSTNQRVLIYQDNEKSIFIPKTEDDTFEKKYIIVSSAELSELVFEHYEKEISFNTCTPSLNVFCKFFTEIIFVIIIYNMIVSFPEL